MNEISDPSRFEPAAPAAKVDLLTAPIPQTSYTELVRGLEEPAFERGRVLAFCNVHSWFHGCRHG